MTNPFPSVYEEFIYKSRYARWREEEGRRENWNETVRRLVDFYRSYVSILDSERDFDSIYNAIYNLEVMPSMRALMTAGPALERSNVAGYNCAYLPVDSPRSFDETFYILMCGTGVGYSVESKYVSQLPRISEAFEATDTVIKVGDSKEGWAKSLRELISLLIAGQVPRWDTTGVRPAGERLKTFGGRSSGPRPLEELFQFCVSIFRGAAGRRLSPLECHDILCKIGDTVVVGGVRRSAMISLFDVTDDRMSKSKSGAWWEGYGHRALANNSAVYDRRPDPSFFMKKWRDLYDSKSGEPGIFSRYACQQIAARNGRRDNTFEFGTNPCSEIILRPFQFCNLTEVVVRATDGLGELRRKVRIASILGTIQATLTDFKYLRKIWQKQCEEEALLGVSLTGILDHPTLASNKEWLEELKNVAVETNLEWARHLGINPAAAVTCVKPSGTVSQLVDSASGLHTRHSRYYLRTVRGDNKDPLTQFLKDAGVYNEPAFGKEDTTTVFYFAKAAPSSAKTREHQTAIEALETWKTLQDHWCEHKPSVTISVKDEEWMEVGAWVYKNFDALSGISFLPYDGGSYKQAPYQELDEDAYNDWVSKHPISKIDWNDMRFYETEDKTIGSQEFACVSGQCDVVDITSSSTIEADG